MGWGGQGGKYLGHSEKQSFLLPAYLSHCATCFIAKEKSLKHRSHWSTSLPTEHSRAFSEKELFITIFINS